MPVLGFIPEDRPQSKAYIGEQTSFVVLKSPFKRMCDMYATVRRYEGATDPSETGRRVNEGFVPIISQIPGFVALYLVDAGVAS